VKRGKIDPRKIQSLIKKNKILNKIIYFDSIDSTNKFLSDNDFASGTVVISARQESGRGKHGAVWVSPRGGLWFSFVLKVRAKRPYDYVIASSAAVVEALAEEGIAAEIKWPNDIIVKGKKAAGILLENSWYDSRLITGIGINVNNAPPKGAGINAISLRQAGRRELDISMLASGVLNRIDANLKELSGNRKKLINRWMACQKNLEGTVIQISNKGRKAGAKVVKVTEQGIVVKTASGRQKTVSGEVFFV
jgi:BirA family biotin operon repressor/biotin-[acetyl-CoA-carboxylase] ligase